MALEQISIKTTEETKRKYLEILENTPGNTITEKFANIIDRVAGTGNQGENPVNLEDYVKKSEYDELAQKLTNAQQELETTKRTLENSSIDAQKTNSEQEDLIGRLKEELREEKNRYAALSAKLEEPRDESQEMQLLREESSKNADIANAVQIKYERALQRVTELEEELETTRDRLKVGRPSPYEPDPFTEKLLILTCEKLKKFDPIKYKGVKPEHLMRHAFNAYTINRHAQIFWKFVLDDADILACAQEINDKFHSIKDIKKYLFG